MGEEESKNVEAAAAASEAPPLSEPVKAVDDADKMVIPPPRTPVDDSKAIVVVEKVADVPSPEKGIGGSVNRDAVLARVETAKKNSLIKAWEESEKTKAANKAQKRMSSISSWENSKQAAIEAELRKLEEALEMKKAQYEEKMKNKIAMIHKAAEEKRAIVEAKRGEDLLKAEEEAAKCRSKGLVPKKSIGCFGS